MENAEGGPDRVRSVDWKRESNMHIYAWSKEIIPEENSPDVSKAGVRLSHGGHHNTPGFSLPYDQQKNKNTFNHTQHRAR